MTNDEKILNFINLEKPTTRQIIEVLKILARKMIDEPIPECKGTLSGWILYQHKKDYISGFYTGVWIDRLDQIGTNKFKETSDYPDYDKKIDKLRPSRLKPKKPIVDGMFNNTYEKARKWYESL